MEMLCAAAAAAVSQRDPALLALPDLDCPPTLMTTWELEAVAAALPAKKARLRETFDLLAACSPEPLPFRWDDLDAYISSMQYSVTLRFGQIRAIEKARSVPATALVPALAASDSTGGGEVVEKGRKRKAAGEAQEAMLMVAGEDAAAAKNTPLLQLQDPMDDNDPTIEAHLCTDTTARVDPVCTTRQPSGATYPRRRCPPHYVPVSVSASTPAAAPPVPAITGCDYKMSNKQKVKDAQMPPSTGKKVEENSAADKKPSHKGVETKPSLSPPGDGVDSGLTKIAHVPHKHLATMPHASNAGNFTPARTSLLVASAPKPEPSEEVADVEMPAVDGEQTKEVIQEDAPEPASTLNVRGIHEADRVISQIHVVACSNGFTETDVSTVTTMQAETGNNLVLQAQDAVQSLTKEPGKSGPAGQDIPEAARGLLLPSDSRNTGNGKGKLWVNRTSENSRNSNKFCYKCGSKGHVAHMCCTANDLVELYLKNKKENRVCYKCGTKGHLARQCCTPKHLVDLYQNSLATKKASFQATAPHSNIRIAVEEEYSGLERW
jgi:hypothetical protein